ncbi:hypothetical protein NHX12_034189, partial [Muraenolepis orangiensis]
MSKATVRKLHWRSKVQESFVPLGGASGELGVAIGGGADYGEFPFVTAAPGGGATVGDVILEIGATPVLGMTLGDVRGVLNTCPHPIRIKTVSPGSSLCKDLRLFLSKCFTPGSLDGQLQQIIRENLYIRAVPCTTRAPKEEEISGVDYNFVSIQEFFSLEESGALLESGKFKGNYYGTPRPVHIGPESPPITYLEHRNLLRNFRTRSKSLIPDFTDQASQMQGSSVPVRLTKGPRGFGFNIVGGSRPREYLQVYSITPGADILLYISGNCVLGLSHKEVVEMLQSVAMGTSVDVVLRRGYPMMYYRDHAHPPCGFNGCPAASARLPAPRPGTSPRGELLPVALGQSEGGLGFSVRGGGAGGQQAVVRRVWDRRHCPALQAGDVITKINGADVLHLTFIQVQRVLQEHTRRGEVVLLVTRGAPVCSPVVTPNLYKTLPSPLNPASSPVDTPSSSSGAFLGAVPPLSQAGTGPAEGPTLTPPTRQGQSPSGPGGLVQSTSFLDSVPVTLTLEPRDWLGVEESVRGGAATLGAAANDGGAGGCVMSHRFVTVRRGSPAARSGVIQPGDRLEGVEGRTATSMSHRELAQILRRAGDVLRKGGRQRSKEEQWFYRVDLERGPTGFGFSLRGGSEYNMGLYVLALMEGGPAQHCGKIQISDQLISDQLISDQLVQINGGSTVGMTHGQAVEHIRRGGSWIHLVLRKGNGYVPDYGI